MKSYHVPDWKTFEERFNRPDDYIQVDDEGPVPFTNASFTAIRAHFKNQLGSLLRTCHRLTYNCLYLSSFDRQKVHLVDALLHDTTIASMIAAGESDTAQLMQVFRTWFDIHNVKTRFKGKRLAKPACEPITREGWKNGTQMHRKFLTTFVAFVKLWHEVDESKGHRLSASTYFTFIQSTQTTIDFVDYIFETYEEVNYILLGKLQTDDLEHFFGKLRTMNGFAYRISIAQVKDTVKKLRNRHLLSWIFREKLTKKQCIDGEQSSEQLEEEELSKEEFQTMMDMTAIFETDWLDRANKEPNDSINYIAGACTKKILGRNGGKVCSTCSERYTTDEQVVEDAFHDSLNRKGAFINPSEESQYMVRVMLGLLLELTHNIDYQDKFHSHKSAQHSILCNLTTIALESSNIVMEGSCDDCQVDRRFLIKKFVVSCAHTLLKNHVGKENNNYQSEQATKRIKAHNEKLGKIAKKQRLTLLSQQMDTMEFESQMDQWKRQMETPDGNDEPSNSEVMENVEVFDSQIASSSQAMKRLTSPDNPNLAHKLQIFGNRSRY